MILPETNAISQLIDAPLGSRPGKPRTTGLTMVIDKGLGCQGFEDLLDSAAAYIDILKFGFGSALLYSPDALRQKLRSAGLYGVTTCTGGTLAEIAWLQGKFDVFLERVTSVGFQAVEISDGTIQLQSDIRRSLIEQASKSLTVISEVGKKLDEFPTPELLVEQILADLEAGSSLVIVEARESGEDIGIYGQAGALEETILERIIELLPPTAASKVMWEAPKKAQQLALLQRFGQGVNLGNIAPGEALALECLRLGLRSDTLALTLKDPS